MKLIQPRELEKIEKLTKSDNTKYITFHMNTRNIKSYETLDLSKYNESEENLIIYNDYVLIFDREFYIENLSNNMLIQKSIDNISFSCSRDTKEYIKKYIKQNPLLNFEKDRHIIVEKIEKHINSKNPKTSKAQALKLYNNIMKRLKYISLSIFEKTNEQREENFKKGLKNRDIDLKEKKRKEENLKEFEDKQKKYENSLNF